MKHDIVFEGGVPRSTGRIDVTTVDGETVGQRSDSVAVEEPLEIRLAFTKRGERRTQPISITMRTPGNDFELAAGFLYSESIVGSSADIAEVSYCGEPEGDGENSNVVRVELGEDVEVELMRLQRHFYTTSSCGVCGKTSLEALDTVGCEPMSLDGQRTAASLIHQLPRTLREQQDVFDQTGGLHAAALFDHNGELVTTREDVGRHNALDKLVGAHLLAADVPLERGVLMLSGRASFELIQKALMARIPIVAAVGAPSSLAIDLADRFGITLLGFVRDDRFNVYTHPERISVKG